MSKRSIYTCDNEHGNDPCEFGGREISDADLKISFDIDKNPKCPGKTRSGKDCGDTLHFLKEEGGQNWALIVGGILVALALIAFAGYWMLGGGGEPLIKVEPASLILPQSEAGAATASIRIHNNGDGELVIDRIEAKPPVFSTSKDEIQVEPNDTATLFVHFKSPSAEKVEGELVLYSNAPDSPSTIRLTANQDPWWVYQELKTSSKTISTKP